MTQITQTQQPCGIVVVSDNDAQIYLPLEAARVQARIVDATARVTLTQVFSNSSSHVTSQTRYVFPVPARGAVCAFEMKTDDGRVIRGIAKERKQAAAEHEEAIQAGKMTSLVEWSTDDVFSISLGPVPAGQRIETTITYVLDLLADDAKDRIRFQLPMYVGARYGSPPSAVASGIQAPFDTRVKISVDIQTQQNIREISSPTHEAIKILSGGPKELSGQASVGYESTSFLHQDFILLVDANGLESPRGFAERHPTRPDSVAMQLTVVPRFNLPPIPAQEYIFLVDCSGSMGGDRIATAKRSLSALLKSLPRRGTMFNIFRFGSQCVRMSSSSRPYDEQNVREAEEYLALIDANMGGTEILAALKQVFKSRTMALPTSVFVLTDGESYNIDAALSTVSKYVARGVEGAPLRVFTLGIGSTASSAMCEGIARNGNGTSLMAVSTEDILGKCAKLVNAAKSYLLRNIIIDWGVPAKGLQQVPRKIDALYPGHRFIAFALLQGNLEELPREVLVRGQRDGVGEFHELKIPITEIYGDKAAPPLIHTLSAKRLITEIQDSTEANPQEKEKRIIELGVQYQLASRYTSFIAVDNDKEIPSPIDNHFSNPPTTQQAERLCSTGTTDSTNSMGSMGASRIALVRRPKAGGVLARAPPPPTVANWSSAAPTLASRTVFTAPVIGAAMTSPNQASPTNGPFALIRLQSFDGSFPMNEEFIRIVGKPAADLYLKLNVDETVWATILAMAYLQANLKNQPELLDGLVEKATDYISESSLPAGVSFGFLLEQAKTVTQGYP